MQIDLSQNEIIEIVNALTLTNIDEKYDNLINKLNKKNYDEEEESFFDSFLETNKINKNEIAAFPSIVLMSPNNIWYSNVKFEFDELISEKLFLVLDTSLKIEALSLVRENNTFYIRSNINNIEHEYVFYIIRDLNKEKDINVWKAFFNNGILYNLI